MKSAKFFFLVAVGFLASCNSTSTLAPTVPQKAVRSYNATASVGDFLTISIDANANTITYKNYTNSETGTVPYSVNADGTYTITDPKGNLLSAYEVPGSALVVEAANAGPNKDTTALITAVESVPATINTFAGRSFNYIQFRTASGGVSVGTVTIDLHGDVQHDDYWPYGELLQPQNLFNGGTFPASSVTEDASGNFFTITESGSSSPDYVFGTQNGFFAVDTGNGTILGLPKALSKSFSAANAGTYTAIFYQKSSAQTGAHNVESGTPTEGKATVTIGADGSMTITDDKNSQLASGTLAAVADTPRIYDINNPNTLPDPCYGTFTFRSTTTNSQQDLFVIFQSNAVIFSSFQTALPLAPYGQYTYFYGVGLK